MALDFDTTTPEDLLNRQWHERKELADKFANLLQEVEGKMRMLGMQIPPPGARQVGLKVVGKVGLRPKHRGPVIRDREEAGNLATIDAVRDAMKGRVLDWSRAEVTEILQAMDASHSPAGISSAIQRLRDLGEVEETVKGGRGKPGRYKFVNNAS